MKIFNYSFSTDVMNVLMVIAIAAAVIVLAEYLIQTVGYYRMFRKAGEKGWKAFVPFVNDMTRFGLYWNQYLYIPFLLIPFVTFSLSFHDNVFAAVLTTAGSIAVSVLYIVLQVKTARCHGKGVGTSILMVLFPGLTSLFLGFGKSTYEKLV